MSAERTGQFRVRKIEQIDRYTLGSTKVFQLHILKLYAKVFRQTSPTREYRDIFKHRFSAIAKARRLNRSTLQGAA